MIAVAIFIGITGAALLLGYFSFKITRHVRLVASIPATIATGIVAIVLSAFAYLVGAISFPASDAINWSALDKINGPAL